jgi:hypothetical protein
MGKPGHVIVVGRVIRVRPHAGGWRIRLTETGGTLAAAEIRSWDSPLPPIGARILIHGRLRYDEQHGWHTVDPVEEWHRAPDAADE